MSRLAFTGSVFCVLAIAGCSAVPGSGARKAGDTGLDRIERLALTANTCWFKSNDPAFADYSLAPELSSFSGRPRFLLVPRGRLEDRPLLVVEGYTGSSETLTYGPLLGERLGRRIEADLQRWGSGSRACSA